MEPGIDVMLVLGVFGCGKQPNLPPDYQPSAAPDKTVQNVARSPVAAETAPPPSMPSPKLADGTVPPTPEIFEPTPEEKEQGIDPNDPSIWKPGYLGPGIERASSAQPRFEATEDERTQGIDPNDPVPWPEGYRGPAIERAMKG